VSRTRVVSAGSGAGELRHAQEPEALRGRRRAARRTALLLAAVVLAIYLGFFVLEAYR